MSGRLSPQELRHLKKLFSSGLTPKGDIPVLSPEEGPDIKGYSVQPPESLVSYFIGFLRLSPQRWIAIGTKEERSALEISAPETNLYEG